MAYQTARRLDVASLGFDPPLAYIGGVHAVAETAPLIAVATAAATEEEQAGWGDATSKRAFDRIKAGLKGASAIARGEADPKTYRVHVPTEVDVKAIGRKLGMSQVQFAASFRLRPRCGAVLGAGPAPPRAFLKVIDR